jgi:hypothetical protein
MENLCLEGYINITTKRNKTFEKGKRVLLHALRLVAEKIKLLKPYLGYPTGRPPYPGCYGTPSHACVAQYYKRIDSVSPTPPRAPYPTEPTPLICTQLATINAPSPSFSFCLKHRVEPDGPGPTQPTRMTSLGKLYHGVIAQILVTTYFYDSHTNT